MRRHKKRGDEQSRSICIDTFCSPMLLRRAVNLSTQVTRGPPSRISAVPGPFQNFRVQESFRSPKPRPYATMSATAPSSDSAAAPTVQNGLEQTKRLRYIDVRLHSRSNYSSPSTHTSSTKRRENSCT